MSGPGAFTQLQPGSLAALAAEASRPRTRRRSEAVALLCDLVGHADWRNGEISHWSSGKFATAHGWSWWRLRRTLDALAEAGTVVETPGVLRVNLSRMVRPRDGDGRFVALVPGALADLAAHHGLSPLASTVFAHLVLTADDRTHEVAATSQTSLAEACSTGWRAIHTAMDELENAGLVTASFFRGQRVDIQVIGRAAVVMPPSSSSPRRKRRHTARPKGHADEAAGKIWAHFALAGSAPAGLVAAVRAAARSGADPSLLVERVVAGGGLAGSRDPVAVLIGRVRGTVDALAEAARRVEQERRKRQRAEALLRAAESESDDRTRRAAADSRWVSEALGPLVLVEMAPLLGNIPGFAHRLPLPAVAAMILDWARRTVAARSDLDPTEALRLGVGHDPPPGPAPPIGRDAIGPTIIEVLTRR